MEEVMWIFFLNINRASFFLCETQLQTQLLTNTSAHSPL